MLANYLIGLREGLEAALVVVILVAYLVRSGRSGLVRWVWAGVLAAVVVSLAFGATLTYGPRGLTFEAQEAIGGALSVLAVAFVTWMIFWMARTARHLSTELKGAVDRAAEAGPLSVVVVAVLAVGREGLETALFLWSATSAATRDNGSTTEPIVGAALGLATAVLLGWLFYKGALRIDLGRFFTWTGFLLIFVAAGVLSYGVHDLQEAGVLPGLHDLAFDVSGTVPPDSVVGTLLKGTLNFSPATTWLEAVVWVLYVVPVVLLFLRQVRSNRHKPSSSPSSAPTKEVTA